MKKENKYITRNDFHNGKEFLKINRHIDVTLRLIERLLTINSNCHVLIKKTLQVEDYIIDYRIEQFGYYENILKCIYFECFSLKYVYDISTHMDFNGVANTIGITLRNQKAYITFSAIVRLYNIFEYTRKIYEKNTKSKDYFTNLKNQYPIHLEKVESLELLRHFRNTIHSNGKWDSKEPLTYKLREGNQEIKKGEVFTFDYWKLYRIIKDCLELNLLLASDNLAVNLRKTRMRIGDQQLSIFKTGIPLSEWNKILFDK